MKSFTANQLNQIKQSLSIERDLASAFYSITNKAKKTRLSNLADFQIYQGILVNAYTGEVFSN